MHLTNGQQVSRSPFINYPTRHDVTAWPSSTMARRVAGTDQYLTLNLSSFHSFHLSRDSCSRVGRWFKSFLPLPCVGKGEVEGGTGGIGKGGKERQQAGK
ncbi:hypothetical protein E2C01_047202 [Portunus trituberculatus]|uniref:Uncharacterized protein n=1 Tax=Portunus trituberculatus TaxID=210409 RepID=A0A5B7G7X2_PORTR|nr:hypothetical protein [Portunus trituberculatus]